MSNRNKTRRVALLGLATACAIIFSYVELLLPPLWQAVPGVKVGLANVAVIYLMYKDSVSSALAVSVVRIFIVALLFGNIMTLAYSVAGALLSIAVMALLKKTDVFSLLGVSVAGGVAHNLGQIIAAMLLPQTKEIGYYMVVLAVTGTLAGIAVGIGAALLIKYTEKIRI